MAPSAPPASPQPTRSAQPRAGEQGQAAEPPYKQIECEELRRLCLELSPAALKVWMFHLSLSHKGDSSYAKVETIAAGTGLHPYTVKIARGWLRANGWLELVTRRKFGSASLPELRCVLPGPRVQKTPSLSSGRLKKTPWARVQKTTGARVQKTTTEVDVSLEVDKTPEVQLRFPTMETAVLPFVTEKRESDKSSSSSGKADDDSLPRPDREAPEPKIQEPIEKAKTILLREDWDPHLASAALQLIEERAGYSGTTPSSENYFIVAFVAAMANRRDKAEIIKRAERLRRVMPSDELHRTVSDLTRESKASGRPIREITEDPAAVALWQKILSSAEKDINKHSFSTWLRPTRGESLKGGRLRVRVPSVLFSRRLAKTYRAILRKVLAQVGQPNLALAFVHGYARESDARQ
jgi:DnaA-like protein